MTHLDSRLLILAAALLVLAGIEVVGGWYNEEARRIRRGLRKVLKGRVDALMIADGQGRGAAFNFGAGVMAVAWDAGAWCLVYRIDEMLGLELVVDSRVVWRAVSGEQRIPLEAPLTALKQVAVRLAFDDPKHAAFFLELWSASRRPRRSTSGAAQAIDDGVDWLARVEPLLRHGPLPLLAGYRTSMSARFAWPSTPPHIAVSPTPELGEG
jgi:hypothetical protein